MCSGWRSVLTIKVDEVVVCDFREKREGGENTHSYWSSFTTMRVLQETHTRVIRHLFADMTALWVGAGEGHSILGSCLPSGREFWNGWRSLSPAERVGRGNSWPHVLMKLKMPPPRTHTHKYPMYSSDAHTTT